MLYMCLQNVSLCAFQCFQKKIKDENAIAMSKIILKKAFKTELIRKTRKTSNIDE